MAHDGIIEQISKIDLMNNLGILDNNNPFPIFGPLPVAGSYLNFWSNEFSNKDITQIIFQINWVEESLPLNFANYYEGYDLGYKNTSFKIEFSLFYKGYTELLHECPFSLFEEHQNDGRISLISTFYLKVNKKLLLIGSPSQSTHPMGECFFTMKLIKPKEGFGHKHYPAIYREVILHNAKKWSKKKTVPSKPYIPMVKKIDISMTSLKT